MTRPGLSLVEVLIVLTMVGMVGTLATRTLRSTERHASARLARDARAIVADDVVRISEAAIAGRGVGLPVELLGDTAIDWGQLVARGLPCAASSDTVLLPLTSASVWWGGPPDTIDLVTLEQRTGVRTAHRIRDARQRAPTPFCPSGAWRLQLDPPLPGSASPSVPIVHVERRVRFVVYRGSDGAWWWGERRCSAGVGTPCGAAQPITGPLPAGRQSFTVQRSHELIAIFLAGFDADRRASLAGSP